MSILQFDAIPFYHLGVLRMEAERPAELPPASFASCTVGVELELDPPQALHFEFEPLHADLEDEREAMLEAANVIASRIGQKAGAHWISPPRWLEQNLTQVFGGLTSGAVWRDDQGEPLFWIRLQLHPLLRKPGDSRRTS